MKALLLSLIILTNSAFAACEKNVQQVTAGTPAPCDGFHVSEAQLRKFDKAMSVKPLAQDLSQVNEQLIRLSEVEIEYYKKQSQSLRTDLDKAETRRFWATVGAFALGVVLTGVAAKAAIESTR